MGAKQMVVVRGMRLPPSSLAIDLLLAPFVQTTERALLGLLMSVQVLFEVLFEVFT